MINLIQNVVGKVYTVTTGNVNYFMSITGQIQGEDYIKLNTFTAYLQNLTKTPVTEALQKPLTFGLANQYNLPIETLYINY